MSYGEQSQTQGYSTNRTLTFKKYFYLLNAACQYLRAQLRSESAQQIKPATSTPTSLTKIKNNIIKDYKEIISDKPLSADLNTKLTLVPDPRELTYLYVSLNPDTSNFSCKGLIQSLSYMLVNCQLIAIDECEISVGELNRLNNSIEHIEFDSIQTPQSIFILYLTKAILYTLLSKDHERQFNIEPDTNQDDSAHEYVKISDTEVDQVALAAARFACARRRREIESNSKPAYEQQPLERTLLNLLEIETGEEDFDLQLIFHFLFYILFILYKGPTKLRGNFDRQSSIAIPQLKLVVYYIHTLTKLPAPNNQLPIIFYNWFRANGIKHADDKENLGAWIIKAAELETASSLIFFGRNIPNLRTANGKNFPSAEIPPEQIEDYYRPVLSYPKEWRELIFNTEYELKKNPEGKLYISNDRVNILFHAALKNLFSAIDCFTLAQILYYCNFQKEAVMLCYHSAKLSFFEQDVWRATDDKDFYARYLLPFLACVINDPKVKTLSDNDNTTFIEMRKSRLDTPVKLKGIDSPNIQRRDSVLSSSEAMSYERRNSVLSTDDCNEPERRRRSLTETIIPFKAVVHLVMASQALIKKSARKPDKFTSQLAHWFYLTLVDALTPECKINGSSTNHYLRLYKIEEINALYLPLLQQTPDKIIEELQTSKLIEISASRPVSKYENGYVNIGSE